MSALGARTPVCLTVQITAGLEKATESELLGSGSVARFAFLGVGLGGSRAFDPVGQPQWLSSRLDSQSGFSAHQWCLALRLAEGREAAADDLEQARAEEAGALWVLGQVEFGALQRRGGG